MHWTPLSGAQFEDVFGPACSGSRVRQRRLTQRAGRTRKRLLNLEHLEEKAVPAIAAGALTPAPVAGGGIVSTITDPAALVTGNQDTVAAVAPTFNLPSGSLLPGGPSGGLGGLVSFATGVTPVNDTVATKP